jgi:F0F1-type ATP synthase assembly protein I
MRWLARLDTLALGGTVAFLLLAPTLVGVAIDRATGIGPWGLVMGSLLGVMTATIAVAGMVLGQYQRLAPAEDPEEEDGR